MNTLEFKKAIKTKLLTYCSEVFFELADTLTPFPCIVFSLPTSYQQELYHYRQVLWIDIYDTDMDNLDILTDSLITGLDLFRFHNAFTSFELNLDTIDNITDIVTDQSIKRKRLAFNVILI